MNVLVTGANGQLGMSLRAVVQGVFTDVTPGAEYLDITDLSAIRRMVRERGIDTIVNCAAFTDVEGAEDKPELARLLNATAPGYLARAMQEAGGLLIHISTDYIFDGTATGPIREDAAPNPLSVYGLTKWEGEEAIRRSGARHVIIRTAWLYSEYGKNFVKTMLRLTAERPTLKVVADQFGTPTYAGDLAKVLQRFFVAAASQNDDGSPFCHSERSEESLVYNYTNEGACSWFDFACAIAREAGHSGCDIQPCRSVEYPTKARRPAYSVLDKSAIKAALGLEIPHWEDSLRACLKKLL